LGVNSSWRFIQEYKWRVPYQSHCNWKLSSVSSWKLIGSCINVVLKIHVSNLLINNSFFQIKPYTFQSSIYLKMFKNSQTFKNGIKLWTVSNLFSCLFESTLSCNIWTVNAKTSWTWEYFTG
jgi:hypothetical protein